jgi:hypothetical protein
MSNPQFKLNKARQGKPKVAQLRTSPVKFKDQQPVPIAVLHRIGANQQEKAKKRKR